MQDSTAGMPEGTLIEQQYSERKKTFWTLYAELIDLMILKEVLFTEFLVHFHNKKADFVHKINNNKEF